MIHPSWTTGRRLAVFKTAVVNTAADFRAAAPELLPFLSELLWYLGTPVAWVWQLLRLLMFVLLLLPFFLPPAFEYATNPSVRKGLRYGPSVRHALDVYVPTAPNGHALLSCPVVVFVTGGAWIIGYRMWGFLLGLALFTACHFALLARTERATLLRIALAFAFGLVHGFGFAGVLAEMSLPAQRLVPALIGFNLGVEVGQLVLVAIALVIATLFRGRLPQFVTPALAASLCGIGVYWFIGRTLA